MFGKRMAWNELVLFTRQLSSSLEMKLPLHEAVRAGIDAVPRHLRRILDSISSELESGVSFSSAISRHPRTFPKYFVEMVRVGEESGTLPSVLKVLSEKIESSHERIMKFRHSFHYPIVVLAVGIFMAGFHLVFIVPKYVEIFYMAGMEMPSITKFTVFVGNIVMHYFPVISILFVLFIAFAAWLLFSSKRPQAVDALLWKCPLLGRLIRGTETALVCRVLKPLLTAGVPLPEALRLGAQSSRNAVAQRCLTDGARRIEKGDNLGQTLSRDFPESFGWMVAASEKRGDLVDSLDTIADYYGDQADSAIEIVKQILEPALLIVTAIIIGIIVLSVYLPVFALPTNSLIFGG